MNTRLVDKVNGFDIFKVLQSIGREGYQRVGYIVEEPNANPKVRVRTLFLKQARDWAKVREAV